MITIIAVTPNGTREEITDLYWFEEEGVHTLEGEGMYILYYFEIFIDGKLIYSTVPENVT